MEAEADLSPPIPSWVVIEPGIYCKDLASYRGNGVVLYSGSGEEDAAVEVSAEACASNGELVRVSLDLRAPPGMSRLFVHLATPRRMYNFDSVVAAQRDAVLLSLEIDFKGIADRVSYAIDYFICRASSSGPKLSLLPRCYPTQREYDGAPDDSWMKTSHVRMRDTASVGLLLTGAQGFVVAELDTYPPNVDHDAGAPLAVEIFRLRSSDDGKWEAKIATARGGKAKMGAVSFWQSHQVLPFTSYLCWIDYHRGIIFCDVNHENPDLQYVSLPVDPVPPSCAEDRCTACPRASRTVCVTNYDDKMKFVSVVRSDGILCGASKPGTSFSITIWTLRQGYDEMEWVKESVTESDQLWAMEGYNDQPLPHIAPQFPLLSMENPHIIHFVLRERDLFDDKTMMWFVTVDIVGKKVLSYKDIKAIPSGEPDEDTHSIFLNTPFFPIEFPKYLKKPTSSNIIEAYARSHLQTKRKKKLAWRKMDLS